MVAYYQNLVDTGEEEHLARDNTSKWAAKSNKGINGKYFCVGILSYYYCTTKLIFILFFSNYILYNINRIWNPPKATSY